MGRGLVLPGEAQLGELGAELVGAFEGAPVTIASDLDAMVTLELEQLAAFWRDVWLWLDKRCVFPGHQKVDGFIELAGEVILPLGVRAAGSIGRAI